MPSDVFSSLLIISPPQKGSAPHLPFYFQQLDVCVHLTILSFWYFCGAYFSPHDIICVYMCDIFLSLKYHSTRYSFSLGKKNTISMANDGTENWQKTVLLPLLAPSLSLAFSPSRLFCFHRVSVVYDKWWCQGMCIMLNNILVESRELSVVNRSQIWMSFEEVVKLNGVMHSWKETAVSKTTEEKKKAPGDRPKCFSLWCMTGLD